MQVESSSLALKLDPTAWFLGIFRKEKRNLPACCRGFAISTLARSVSGLDASATALQTLPFLCSSGSSLDASNGVLNAEAHVLEVALPPAERPEFALTNSQSPF